MLGSKQTKMARRNWLAVCTILVTMATLMIVAKLAHCDQGQDCSQHLEPQSKSSQLAALVSATKGKASKGTPSLDIVRNIVRGALEGELIKDDDCSDEMGKLKKLVEMLEAREQCYKGSRIAMGIHSLVEFVKEHANVVKPPGSIHAATGGDGGHQVQLLLEQLNQKNQELAARDEQIKLVQSEKADMQVQLNQRDQELSSERKLIEELSQIVANLEKQLLDCESSAGGAGAAGAAGADSSIETNEREIPNPYADQMRQLAEEEERKKRENKPRRQRHIVQTWYS